MRVRERSDWFPFDPLVIVSVTPTPGKVRKRRGMRRVKGKRRWRI